MLAGDLILPSYQLTQSQEWCQASIACCKRQCFMVTPLSRFPCYCSWLVQQRKVSRGLSTWQQALRVANMHCLLVLTHSSSLSLTWKSSQTLTAVHNASLKLHNLFRLVRLWRGEQGFVGLEEWRPSRTSRSSRKYSEKKLVPALLQLGIRRVQRLWGWLIQLFVVFIPEICLENVFPDLPGIISKASYGLIPDLKHWKPAEQGWKL